MLSQWPEIDQTTIFENSQKDMESIMEAIRVVRNLRAEMNVPLGKKAPIILHVNKEHKPLADQSVPYFKSLASGQKVY